MRREVWRLDELGWLKEGQCIPSPNCDERPPGESITLLVVHNISLPPGEFGGPGVVDLFTNRLDPAAHPYYKTIRGQRVSSHFLIRRDGGLIQFVPCGKRAWHAGTSSWKGRPRCNDYSIGVELEGADDLPYTDAQYERLAELIVTLRRTYPELVDLAGHADVAPGRKTDPGPHFDWERLRASLAVNR